MTTPKFITFTVIAILVGGTGSYGIHELVAYLNWKEGPILTDNPKYQEDYGGNASGTVGYGYGRFMADPDKESELWEEISEAIKNIKNQSILGEDFKKIKSEDKKLREVCVDIYKSKKMSDLRDSSNDMKELEKNIWYFCSAIGEKPDFVESGEYGTNTWAGTNNNRLYLLSPKYESKNNWMFWNHIYYRFLKKKQLDESKADELDEIFKNVYSGKSLKWVCEAAYKSNPKDGEEDKYSKNVKEYCSLNAGATFTKNPTKPVEN